MGSFWRSVSSEWKSCGDSGSVKIQHPPQTKHLLSESNAPVSGLI